MAHDEPDGATLARLRAGDIAALAPVFELFGLRVQRLSRRLMGNQADAEDTTQEVFLRIFEQAGKFDGRSRFSTWLYRLALRQCLNRLRERKRRRKVEGMVSGRAAQRLARAAAGPAERLATEDERAAVDELLASLAPHYRACIVLREIEGRPYAEIAELLEIPTGTVMSRLARARAILRARLRPARKGRAAEME